MLWYVLNTIRRKSFSLLRYLVLLSRKGRKMKNINLTSVRKILVVRNDGLGDMILSLPAIRLIKLNYPKAHLAVVVSRRNRDLVSAAPYVDEVIVCDRGEPWIHKLILFLKLLRSRFDFSLDLNEGNTVEMALLTFLSGIRWRAGYDVGRHGFLFSHLCPGSLPCCHEVESTLHLLSWLGMRIFPCSIKVEVLSKWTERVKELLIQKGIDEERLLIGVHVGGRYPSQRWPIERFAHLCDLVTRKYGAQIILTGNEQEAYLVEEVCRRSQEPLLSLAGRLSIGELSALIKRCELYICNNTGTLHLAVGVGTPTVSTLGPTDWERFRPLGENHIVVKKDLPCLGCGLPHCPRMDCLKSITVEEMLEAVDRQLAYCRGKVKHETKKKVDHSPRLCT